MSSSVKSKMHHTFTWNIEHFHSFAERGLFIFSPVFTADCIDQTTWYLRLCPLGTSWRTPGLMPCYLTREDSARPSCEFSIEFIGADGKCILEESGKLRKGKKFGCIHVNTDLFLNKNIFSSADTLTIRCRLMRSSPDMDFFSENVGWTKIGIDQYSFKWVVKDLNTSTGPAVRRFSREGTAQIELRIRIPEDDIRINISRVDDRTYSHYVICKISILDVEGKERDSRLAVHLFETGSPSEDVNDVWEFPTFLKKIQLNSKKSEFLINDSFTLFCEISVSNGSPSEVVKGKKCDELSTSSNTMNVLKDDLKRMYTNKIQADLELSVDSKIFHTHKSILSARSPVFFAMFDQDMVENQTGSVHISDLEAETVESLLEFMYTGTVEHLNGDIAMKLLAAAEKYQILSLKEKCADFLVPILSDANVCNVLVIADLVQHDVLKTSAVNYIKKHADTILLSDEWKMCVENNLKVASETVCKLSVYLAESSKKLCE